MDTASEDPFSELILPQPPPPPAAVHVEEEDVNKRGDTGEDPEDNSSSIQLTNVNAVEEEEIVLSGEGGNADKDGDSGGDDKEEEEDAFIAAVKKDTDFLAGDDDDYDSFQVPTVVPIPPAPPPPSTTPPSTTARVSSSTSPGKSLVPLTPSPPQTAGPSRVISVMMPLKSKKEVDEEDEREKMQLLVSNFSDGQYDRYEMFRRSTFPKAAIKRLMQTITGNAVSQNVVIAMSGIAKVFVGEVVEEALDAMERVGETGPLRPKQLREAVRRLRARSGSSRSSVPRSNTRRYNPFPL